MYDVIGCVLGCVCVCTSARWWQVYTRADRVGDAQPDIHFADYFKWDSHISLVFLMVCSVLVIQYR